MPDCNNLAYLPDNGRHSIDHSKAMVMSSVGNIILQFEVGPALPVSLPKSIDSDVAP
jgi:hypothetical protein